MKTRFLSRGAALLQPFCAAASQQVAAKRCDVAASLPAIQYRCKELLNLHSCALLLHQAPAHLAAARARERIAKNQWTTSAP